MEPGGDMEGGERRAVVVEGGREGEGPPGVWEVRESLQGLWKGGEGGNIQGGAGKEGNGWQG